MASNFRIFYLYIVSLITLFIMIGGIVSTVNNITSYFFPDSYVFFETGETDKVEYDYGYEYGSENNNEIRRQNYKNEKIKNAIVSLATIAVGGIMYKYHWNIIENERIK